MRLRHIEVIQALLQTGHLGTAAEWLQLPVTDVEERLREAESELGFMLFASVRGRLQSTPEARALQVEIAHVYQALEPVQADACTVQGEAALLESLMVNLADNAVKACGPGGSVRLCARRETGRLTLTVQDTGRGMDAETLAHIGEPFYRPDKARSREQGGAGLGLALCFQIAQSHGAALSFTSAPGAGTTAAVIFTA